MCRCNAIASLFFVIWIFDIVVYGTDLHSKIFAVIITDMQSLTCYPYDIDEQRQNKTLKITPENWKWKQYSLICYSSQLLGVGVVFTISSYSCIGIIYSFLFRKPLIIQLFQLIIFCLKELYDVFLIFYEFMRGIQNLNVNNLPM